MVAASVSPEGMKALAEQMGEVSLFGRTGGAATLAAGMAQIFHQAMPRLGDHWLAIWYHFALMFEALFILTTLDAGTRVGRYLLQDSLKGHLPRLADTRNTCAGVFASALVCIGWGFFLIMGVRDPEGGVKALWPIFGIANQLLASIALCLATTILIKMQIKRDRPATVALVTLLPLVWLLTVTLTAGATKVWDPSPRIGFLAGARAAEAKLPALEQALTTAQSSGDTTAIAAAAKALKSTRTVRFNNTVDAYVTAIFIILVGAIVILSIYEWMRLLSRAKPSVLSETEPVFLPASALAESRPLPVMGLAVLGFTMLKEISGEAAIDRAQACACAQAAAAGSEQPQTAKYRRQNAFLTATEDRYNGVNRCC